MNLYIDNVEVLYKLVSIMGYVHFLLQYLKEAKKWLTEFNKIGYSSIEDAIFNTELPSVVDF